MILLPCVCSLFLLFFFRNRNGWGTSLLYAAACLGVLTAAGTEVLGACSLLSPRGAMLFWACASAGAVAAFAARAGRGPQRTPGSFFPTLLPAGQAARVIAIMLAVLTITETFIALAAAPNNWDSMTYHLARVMHWAQDRSAGFYASNILRQLYFPTFAENAALQSVLLARGDRFASCVQLLSMAGSCAGALLIAKELGAGRTAQLLSALVAATVPMAVLQSTSTQNDLAAGLWLTCFTLFMLRLGKTPGPANCCAAGASLGLALLTKGTAFLFAPCIFAGVLLLWRFNRAQAGDAGTATFRKEPAPGPVLGIAALAIAACIAAPHSLRNQALFHSPLGPGGSSLGVFNVNNERFTPAILGANIVRNIGLHMGTPSKKINALLEKGIYRLLGSEATNPASTWIDSRFRVRPGLHEDMAGNPLHALAIAAAVCLLFTKRIRRRKELAVYAAMLAAAFLLFCGLLKWQPFHSRLHLPLFLLAAPLIAAVAGQVFSRRALAGIAAFFFLGALPWLGCNVSRPLVGGNSVVTTPRETQYFANRPALHAAYAAIADSIAARAAGSVGLAFEEDDWEYPLWVMLQKRVSPIPRIEHVLVRNPSAVLSHPDFIPDLIITTRNLTFAQIGAVSYRRSYSIDGIHLLFPVR